MLITGLGLIKLHSQRNEPLHSGRRLLDQNSHCLLITKARTSSNRILEMQFRTIVCTQRYRQPSLRVTRITLPKLPLGEKRHTQMLRKAQSDRETCNPPSYYGDII
jgi:hypothetical protein